MIELDTQDDQAAWHQMMLERQEMADEYFKRLAQGKGGQCEIEFLAAYAKCQNPYEPKRKEL